jgi:hypothetical protein
MLILSASRAAVRDCPHRLTRPSGDHAARLEPTGGVEVPNSINVCL